MNPQLWGLYLPYLQHLEHRQSCLARLLTLALLQVERLAECPQHGVGQAGGGGEAGQQGGLVGGTGGHQADDVDGGQADGGQPVAVQHQPRHRGEVVRPAGPGVRGQHQRGQAVNSQ